MDLRERVMMIMEHEGMSSTKFADEIGVQRPKMSHIVSGRNNPSLDILQKILERFTYVSTDWLLFGRGEMKREPVSSSPVIGAEKAENEAEPELGVKNREETEDKVETKENKPTVIERIVYQERPPKAISRIMIFYADNTFDTFVPEKGKKD